MCTHTHTHAHARACMHVYMAKYAIQLLSFGQSVQYNQSVSGHTHIHMYTQTHTHTHIFIYEHTHKLQAFLNKSQLFQNYLFLYLATDIGNDGSFGK